jgi:hypothetical protein
MCVFQPTEYPLIRPLTRLAAPGPKRTHIVMLREIDANELGKLFTKGMEQNAPREEFSKSINGVVQGEPIKEPEFFQALMKIWLGKSPADAQLKERLLGNKPAGANN